MKMTFNDIKTLEIRYAERCIRWLYWASLIITVVSGVFSMFQEGFTFFAFIRGLFIIVFGCFLTRLIAEAALVLFRIESHLRPKEAEAADENQAQD